MGVLIHTTFETPQGFSVSSVYCRITRFTHDPLGNAKYLITMKQESYLNRECRLAGKAPLSTPGLPELISVEGELGTMASLYSLLKADLESRGWEVEDVLEEITSEPSISQQSSEPTQ